AQSERYLAVLLCSRLRIPHNAVNRVIGIAVEHIGYVQWLERIAYIVRKNSRGADERVGSSRAHEGHHGVVDLPHAERQQAAAFMFLGELALYRSVVLPPKI